MMRLPKKQVVLVTQRQTHWGINHCLCIQSADPCITTGHEQWQETREETRAVWRNGHSECQTGRFEETHPACREHKLHSQFITAELLPLQEGHFMLLQCLFTTSLHTGLFFFSTLKPHSATSGKKNIKHLPQAELLFFILYFTQTILVSGAKERSSSLP